MKLHQAYSAATLCGPRTRRETGLHCAVTLMPCIEAWPSENSSSDTHLNLPHESLRACPHENLMAAPPRGLVRGHSGTAWTGNSPDVVASWHDMAGRLLDVDLHLELGPPEGVPAHARSRTVRSTVCFGSLHDFILEWCMAPNDGITRSAFNPAERALPLERLLRRRMPLAMTRRAAYLSA